ncbi:MAG TPA: serine hydrolase domain-containing protein [Gammaproteobacteria bacterium]|nr:serine hydrolase domain-containing protein [Gammaproteobacteria bacterium]
MNFQKITDVCDKYINLGDLAGTQTLVYHKGNIVHHENKGFRDLEKKLPIENNSIFRIYSMTKPVTCVAAMMLYDKNKFKLDTPVSEFIPEFKQTEVFVSGTADDFKTQKPEREITMGDLLSHTSGITYDFMYMSVVDELYRKANIQGLNPQQPLAEMAKLIAQQPLLFSPGKHWAYGLSIDIIGRVVEVISGKSLRDYFKQEIFEPLHMLDTDFYVPKEKQDRFAGNYLKEQTLVLCDDPKTGQFSKPPLCDFGGGGLVSTTEDYLKFCVMLLNNGHANGKQFLTSETIKLMTQNHLPTDINHYMLNGPSPFIPDQAGMGLVFGLKLSGSPVSGNVGSYGWGGAAHTSFFIDPKAELIAIFMTQLFPPDYKIEINNDFRTAVYESIDAQK